MKFVQKNKMELGDTMLPDLFIMNNMVSLEGIDLKLYIYMLFLSKIGSEADKATLAKIKCYRTGNFICNRKITIRRFNYKNYFWIQYSGLKRS